MCLQKDFQLCPTYTRCDWAAELIYFAVGPVTLTAILFRQPAVEKRHSHHLPKNLDAMKLRRIFQVHMKTRPFQQT